MYKKLLLAALPLFISAAPIQTNYFHPNQWMMYNPVSKDLDMSDDFSISLVNTSIYETETKYPDYILDAEILALFLQGSKKLSDKHRVDVSLPFYYMSGGIMDGLVNAFHEVAGITTPRDRNHEVYDKFHYLVKDGNTTVIDKTGNYAAVGNLQMEIVSQWLDGGIDLGTVFGIKLPLNDDPVVTTGGIDAVTGLVLHKGIDQHHLYSNLALTFNTPYDLRSTTSNKVVRFFGSLSYNYVQDNGNIFILEFKYSTAPFEDDTIEYFYEISSATNLGYQIALSKEKALELFVLEDNEPYKNYSDISFGLTYKQIIE